MKTGRWLEISLRSPSEQVHADLLAEGLLALGGRAVEERDGVLLTHVPEPEGDLDAFLRRVRARLTEVLHWSDVEVEHRWQSQEDWSESWKRGLAPRRITPRLVVSPSWCDPDIGAGDLLLTIDPGMAFGTAEHGTTRGCLRLMDGTVRSGDRLVDVGAGSGILSIAAVLLGATDVVAIEGDADAVETMAENLERNGVSSRVRAVTAWADAPMLADLTPRDGVVANIESGHLRPLLPGFQKAIRPGGWLVLSGILAEEWDAFRREVVAAGLTPEAVDRDGEWRSGLFKRPG